MSLSARCKAQWKQWHYAHRAIAQGIAWTLLFVLIGRTVGAGREMAIAARFGTSGTIDAYLFVLTVLTWPVGVWFNVLSVVLVPEALRRRQGAVAALADFRGGLLAISLLAGCACGLLLWFGLESSFLLEKLGFPVATLALAQEMAVRLLPIVPLGFVASFYAAWLMSSGRYVNTLFEAVPALSILIFVMIFSAGGIEPLLWGTLIGFAAQLVLLAGALGRVGELSLPRWRFGGGEWRGVVRNFGTMGIGQALMTASVIIDQGMAGSLEPGTIAMLGYANRIVALLLTVGALSVNRATLPAFSKMRAEADPRLPQVALQWAGFLFVGAAVMSWAAWKAAPALIALLFQRGAFSAADTQAVTSIFSFALVQIPFYCAGLVFTSHLAACGYYWFITGLGAASLVLKPALNLLLMPSLGGAGITLATGIMYAISFSAMGVFVLAQARRPTGRKVISWTKT